MDQRVLLPHGLVGYQGWKFMSYVHCQELSQQASWLLIRCTRVNNQSEARTASWHNSWSWLQLISFHSWLLLAATQIFVSKKPEKSIKLSGDMLTWGKTGFSVNLRKNFPGDKWKSIFYLILNYNFLFLCDPHQKMLIGRKTRTSKKYFWVSLAWKYYEMVKIPLKTLKS